MDAELVRDDEQLDAIRLALGIAPAPGFHGAVHRMSHLRIDWQRQPTSLSWPLIALMASYVAAIRRARDVSGRTGRAR